MKRGLAIVLCLVLGVSLVGCGGDKDKGGDTAISVVGEWVCADELLEMMEKILSSEDVELMKTYVVTFKDDGTYTYDYGDVDREISNGTYTINGDKLIMIGEGSGEFTVDGDAIVHSDGTANYKRK